MDVDTVPWWALSLLAPAAFLARNALLAYQDNEGSLSTVVTKQATGSLLLALLAAIWFFELNWFPS